jgi:uncharacterized membrane protein
MSESRGKSEYHISKNRLETMVDGIFAIAMTILVLGITPPKPDISQAQAVLAGQIVDILPEIFIFIVSFLILAGFWLSHHRQFHFVRDIDSRLLWINIILLISIVFIPFSTDVAGDYPGILIAVLLFHINIIIIGLIFSYQAHYILQSRKLCDSDFDQKFLQGQFHRSVLIPVISFIAVIIAFVNPPVSLLVYLAIPVARFFLQRGGY